MSLRERFRQLRQEWGGRCVMAASPGLPCRGRLEFAHLPGKPTGLCGRGRGMPNRYYDIRNNPEHYVLLCWGHHRRFDDRAWDYGQRQEEHDAANMR